MITFPKSIVGPTKMPDTAKVKMIDWSFSSAVGFVPIKIKKKKELGAWDACYKRRGSATVKCIAQNLKQT